LVTSWAWRSSGPATLQGRALEGNWRRRLGFRQKTAKSARHSGRLSYMLRGHRPGAQAHEEGQDRAALGRFFSTCATCLQPALLLGRPGLDGLANDFFPPARRAYGRLFHWGDRSWRALSKDYECFEENQQSQARKVPQVAPSELETARAWLKPTHHT
jgi:hypothetical protein